MQRKARSGDFMITAHKKKTVCMLENSSRQVLQSIKALQACLLD